MAFGLTGCGPLLARNPWGRANGIWLLLKDLCFTVAAGLFLCSAARRSPEPIRFSRFPSMDPLEPTTSFARLRHDDRRMIVSPSFTRNFIAGRPRNFSPEHPVSGKKVRLEPFPSFRVAVRLVGFLP